MVNVIIIGLAGILAGLTVAMAIAAARIRRDNRRLDAASFMLRGILGTMEETDRKIEEEARKWREAPNGKSGSDSRPN